MEEKERQKRKEIAQLGAGAPYMFAIARTIGVLPTPPASMLPTHMIFRRDFSGLKPRKKCTIQLAL